MNFNYFIKRSQRRTLSITVKNNGQVIVNAPLLYPQVLIESFVEQKSDWVQKQLLCINEQTKYVPILRNNEKIFIIGKYYTVALMDDCKPHIENSTIFLCKSEATKDIVKLLKKIADVFLKERVQYLAEKFNFKYDKVRIGGANKRWGSCNTKKQITVSYRLLLLPEKARDYVIIHELAHTVVFNHSASFYNVVGACMPDYKDAIKILKQNKMICSVFS